MQLLAPMIVLVKIKKCVIEKNTVKTLTKEMCLALVCTDEFHLLQLPTIFIWESYSIANLDNRGP